MKELEITFCPEHGQDINAAGGQTHCHLPLMGQRCGRKLETAKFTLSSLVATEGVYVGYTPLEAVLVAHALKQAFVNRDDAVLKQALDKTEEANAAVLERDPQLADQIRAQIALMGLSE